MTAVRTAGEPCRVGRCRYRPPFAGELDCRTYARHHRGSPAPNAGPLATERCHKLGYCD
mgnify:CR=1 FL=1